MAPPKKTAATAGYSGKPLAAKLGFKEGVVVAVAGAPEHYGELVAERPDGVTLKMATPGRLKPSSADIVHLFVKDRRALEAAHARAFAAAREGGAVWISWPKKSSALFKDVTEDLLREILLPTGWVDVKVCAVDADWSGLKFMRRRAR